MIMKTGSIVLVLTLLALVSTRAGDLANDDPKDVFQTLCKLTAMRQAVSSELRRISSDTTITPDLRQLASDAIDHHDRSATNSYEELRLFIATWTITDAPPITPDTISLMKRSLEYGESASRQLHDYSVNTNIPQAFRDTAAKMNAAFNQHSGELEGKQEDLQQSVPGYPPQGVGSPEP